MIASSTAVVYKTALGVVLLASILYQLEIPVVAVPEAILGGLAGVFVLWVVMRQEEHLWKEIVLRLTASVVAGVVSGSAIIVYIPIEESAGRALIYACSALFSLAFIVAVLNVVQKRFWDLIVLVTKQVVSALLAPLTAWVKRKNGNGKR